MLFEGVKVSHPHSVAARFGRNLSPFARQDVDRVAEFFEGNLDSTYGFCRKTWLPDAELNLHKLSSALSRLNMHDVMFLCDHLREGARCVGARMLMTHLQDIECAARDRDWSLATRLAASTAHYVQSIRTWLGERFEAASNTTRALEPQIFFERERSGFRRHRSVSRKPGSRRL